MKITKLCMGNGDEYEGLTFEGCSAEFEAKLYDKDFIEVLSNSNKIMLNSEFIVSYEIEGARDLRAI